MPSPPIQVFLTSIASQPALRQRQEYILRILQVKKIPFTSYDLASDEDAKKLWRRKAPAGKQQLPGLLVGGVCPGGYDELSEAVEYDELDAFLRLKETWEADPDEAPTLAAKPVGVPGAASPLQMTNHKPSPVSPAPSPLKDKTKKGKELDAGSVLGDSGLQGVNITDSELEALVAELGLEGDEAGELVKSLSAPKEEAKSAVAEEIKPSEKEQQAETKDGEAEAPVPEPKPQDKKQKEINENSESVRY